MDCNTIYLRTNVANTVPGGGVPESGVWTYVGFHASSSTGPFTSIAANPLFSGLTNGDIIPYGDNPGFSKTGKTNGYYKFTYNYTGGFVDVIISVIDDAITAGTNITLNYAASDPGPYNLLTALGATSGGTWTNVDGASGWSAPNFDPSLAGVGTWRFDYSLQEPGFEDLGCLDCPALTTRVTVIVSAAFSVDITAAAGTCTFTYDLESPVGANANEIEIAVAANALKPVISYRRTITSSCDGIILNEVVNEDLGSIVASNWNTTELVTGGYFVSMKLYGTVSGAITVPLSPGTAILTGVAGTVNAADLTFNSIAPYTFATAISKCIRNYLGTLGFTNGVHYDFLTTAPGFSEIGKIFSFFGCKHNPSSEWIGINRSDNVISYSVSGGSPITTTSFDILDSGGGINNIYSNAPCPYSGTKLQYVSDTYLYSEIVDFSTTNYNDIDLLVSSKTLTVNTGASNLIQACNGYTLTANPMNCAATVTYLWSTGATTSSIVVSSGSYSVTATCTPPGTVANDSIVV